MSVVTLPVTFDSATRKRDRSVTLRFTSNTELSPEDLMQLDRLIMSEGHLLFSPNPLEAADIPTEPAKSRESKPKIQRLRGVYYHIWEHRTDQSEPFELYWDRMFEQIMTKAKELID